MKKINLSLSLLLLIALAGLVYGYSLRHGIEKNISQNSSNQQPQVESNQTLKDNPAISPAPKESKNGLSYPVSEFKERITKKPFGIYVSPQNSPVKPERFTGYHTAVDVEYQDVAEDVPVFAINNCEILVSKVAKGYGGVFIISTEIKGSKHSIVYGHIRPSTLPKVNNSYKKGAQIAFLGTGYSSETDGERRHLHFGILSDSGTDLRGYVQKRAELSGWIDPLSIF